MPEYHYQNITLPIDKEGELYKRVEAQAARYGITIERLLDTVIFMGLNGHISVNLALWERNDPPTRPEEPEGDGGAEA